MKELILTKKSNQSEIKQYFQKVLELKQTNEEYPVNLEDVWALVYSEKGKATRALKSNFIENEDFITVAQNGKQVWGGNNKIYYYLSVSCLEYFIARKVRAVFNIYRQVFHKAIEAKPLSTLEMLELGIKQMREQEKRVSVIEDKVKELDVRTSTRPEYFTVVGYAILNHISVSLKIASQIGQKAARYCREMGYPMDEVPDPRFGKVRSYPKIALQSAFDSTIF